MHYHDQDQLSWAMLGLVHLRLLQLLQKRGWKGYMNHGLYPKDFIEESLEDAPGVTHIAIQGTHLDGTELIEVGYRYNSKVILCFVEIKNAGSIREGDPYETKFTGNYGNVHIRLFLTLQLYQSSFKYLIVLTHIIKYANMS